MVYMYTSFKRTLLYFSTSRAMTNNEDDYPEPFEFKPERFLKDGKLNPAVRDPAAGVAFGFGRRYFISFSPSGMSFLIF